MAKSKKTESEKVIKKNGLKAFKEEKSGKEKKDKKKEKAAPAVAAPAPVKKLVKPVKAAAPEAVITTDDISLRAYFIAERRQAMGWPGDSSSDWVEAERQLRAEAKKARA